MKFKKAISMAVAKAPLQMAYKSCGVVLQYEMYQPKEPKKQCFKRINNI